MKDSNSKTRIEGTQKTTVTHKTGKSSNRRRVMGNSLVVWLDDSISLSHLDCQSSVEQLRTIVNDVNFFSDLEECVAFLEDIRMQKVYVIVSASLAKKLVPLIHWMTPLGAIYIYGDKYHHDEAWPKVQGVYNRIEPICEALKLAAKRCDRDSISISFAQPNILPHSSFNSDQLESSFMYTQLFKTALLSIEHTEGELQLMVDYCRKIYATDRSRLELTDEFSQSYRGENAIWWYTRPGFIFETVNRALRLLEPDIIVNMGFFIRDLHRQIEQRHSVQAREYGDRSFTVYRGQSLTIADFEKLKKNEGGLLSFNGFLSTSTNEAVSRMYADVGNAHKGMVGVLFVMAIDPNSAAAPFANIRRESYFEGEDEILFTMHAVFRIDRIGYLDGEENCFEVQMSLTTDEDAQLRALTERYIEELQYSTGWHRVGRLLLLVGSVEKAEELYNALLEQSSDEKDTAFYHYQLGAIESRKGDYNEAIRLYDKSLIFWEKTLPKNYCHLTDCCSSIGSAYDDLGEHSKALSLYEKTLEILLAHFPENHLELASTYNDISGVYSTLGEQQKALFFCEKALDIKQRALPPNHPSLATSYNNAGSVYQDMAKYEEALSFYEKALAIDEIILPPNHPSLAAAYNNVACIYHAMDDNFKALHFFEKALDLWRRSLPENHPSLASVYGNMGAAYNNRELYSKALWFYQKALDVLQTSLSENHASLAVCYNNIGGVCDRMKSYSKALSYYEKALDIWQKVLPANHPVLATAYSNIGGVYSSTKSHSRALSFYEKALEMQQTCVPVNHTDLAVSYNNLALLYHDTGEYSKSLSFYSKALDMWQKTSLDSHSSLAIVYRNTALAYTNLGEYSDALPLFEKALDIYQQTLPAHSLSFAHIYRDIGMLYASMDQYSNALPFYEKAVDIHERTSPINYQALPDVYHRIAFAYNETEEYTKSRSFAKKSLGAYFKHGLLQTVRLCTMLLKITHL